MHKSLLIVIWFTLFDAVDNMIITRIIFWHKAL